MKNNINNPSEKLKIIRTNFSVENMNDNDLMCWLIIPPRNLPPHI